MTMTNTPKKHVIFNFNTWTDVCGRKGAEADIEELIGLMVDSDRKDHRIYEGLYYAMSSNAMDNFQLLLNQGVEVTQSEWAWLLQIACDGDASFHERIDFLWPHLTSERLNTLIEYLGRMDNRPASLTYLIQSVNAAQSKQQMSEELGNIERPRSISKM